MSVIKGLEPIVFEDSQILILGSMPSVESLKTGMYYAFKTNRFWKVIGALSQQDTQTYPQRIQALQSLKIALWDAIAQCERKGSSDATIEQAVSNDILVFLKKHPSITKVLCNGKASAKIIKKEYPMLDIVECPSTSAANAQFRLEQLIEIYGKEIGRR